MSPKRWKRARARSLRHGIELCVEYARDQRNYSVDRIAELMGLASKWTLYKYMESGRMPATLIPPFEHACGAHFVTDYLGNSAGRITSQAPRGRKCQTHEVADLQLSFGRAVNELAKFYDGHSNENETLDALAQALRECAWHEQNVTKTAAPELALFGEEGEK